jgi:RNA 2',3'-cyclic 3'-phosphodiesterase
MNGLILIELRPHLPISLLCSLLIMRLFVALDIEEEIKRRIAQFVGEFRAYAPGARWVSAESLHITLKFIGEKPDAMVKNIEAQMRAIEAAAVDLRFCSSGFFPTARSARVFWVGVEAGEALAQIAKRVEQQLAAIGIPEEKRSFSPHLTLARAGSGSGVPGWRKGDKFNQTFSRLQEKLAQSPSPDFGAMTAREFFLYRSQLSSKGAKYTKIARFGLRPAEP